MNLLNTKTGLIIAIIIYLAEHIYVKGGRFAYLICNYHNKVLCQQSESFVISEKVKSEKIKRRLRIFLALELTSVGLLRVNRVKV